MLLLYVARGRWPFPHTHARYDATRSPRHAHPPSIDCQRDRLRRHAHASVAREEVDTLLSRIIVMPRLKHRRFLAMLSTADVVVDSFPFGGFASALSLPMVDSSHHELGLHVGVLGGCTTTYEALAMGTPVVSMPSDALRGRFTMALLQAAGMESLLAESVEQLIGHAINVRTPRHATPRLYPSLVLTHSMHTGW